MSEARAHRLLVEKRFHAGISTQVLSAARGMMPPVGLS